MKNLIFVTVFLLLFSLIKAQSDDPTIMKINGKEIKKSEFEYIYKKNNEEVLDKKSLQEYIELFKNFKLKVIDAEAAGLDTTEAFKREFIEYRNQLAKPYLSNLPIDEEMLRKKYERLKEYYDVSNILIPIPFMKDTVIRPGSIHVLPSDTVAAYKEAIRIYKRLQKGEDFNKIAGEVSKEENPQSTHLGWVTSLMTTPALEEVIYSLNPGEINYPVRSSFGYHIFKVNEKIKNPGEIHTAHIMVACPKDADSETLQEAEKKSEDLYERLKNGADFATLAKEESDDKESAASGGELPWVGLGSMIKEFEEAAFALKNTGDISRPFRTASGIHIIKLLDKRDLKPFEEQREEIINRLGKGLAFIDLNKPGIDKLKKESNFQLNDKAYKMLYNAAEKAFPSDSTFIASFEHDSSALFTIRGIDYPINEFINFLKYNFRSPNSLSTEYLDERLISFESKMLMESEDKNLENKYPEFKNLVNEYRDGILLFEISNNKVWDKAGKDTIGLTNYFEQNKSQYTWDEPHYKGYVVHCKDQKNKKKMMKEISGLSPDSAATYLLRNYRVGEVSYVKIERGLYKKGDNPFTDQWVFKSGKAKPWADYPESFVIGTLLKSPNSYLDVKGKVITDYQNQLEKEWLEELNKKYPVTINQQTVESLK